MHLAGSFLPRVQWGGAYRKMLRGVAIGVAGALATAAAAQTLTIRRQVPEVQMVFSAHDHHGRPLLNLGASQIQVLDNGVAAALTSFQAADRLPVQMALLLDGSDSMRAGFAVQRQAAVALARGAQRSDCDQVFSMEFAARAAAGPDGNPDSVFYARAMGGQTALYDALIAAAERLRSGTPARRVLLLLSDGDDNYSRASLADALAALQQARVTVYAITAHSPRLEYPGDRVLRQIAAATGGRAFLLRNYRQANHIFTKIENDLRGQYVVGFRPPGHLAAGQFHTVRLLAPRSTVIRARAGYYVDPFLDSRGRLSPRD